MRNPRSLRCRILLVLAVTLGLGGGLTASLADAATLRVTSLADPGNGVCNPTECTLREAIAAAQPGDTIVFVTRLFQSGPGTITLANNEALSIDKDLTISGGGAGRLTINGNDGSRVFFISEGAHVIIQGVTIAGGKTNTFSDYGGGLANEGTLTLRNSIINGNTAHTFAGGIYNGGTLTVSNSTISNNTASAFGGLDNAGTLTVSNSTISGNTVDDVGGGLRNNGTLTVRNSTISGNTGTIGSGLFNAGTLTVRNSTISGNTGGGGGLFNGGGLLTVYNSTISGNDGRGIYNAEAGTMTVHNSTISGNTYSLGSGLDNEGTLTLSNSTISGNTALWGGGLRNNGTLTVRNSTISDNTADIDGGGVFNSYDGTIRLRNSIVAGNTGGGHPDDCQTLGGRLISQGHNLVGAGTGCPRRPSVGDLTVIPANVFTQVLGPLQDNGGPTFTHALLPDSPAIDAGDTPTCFATDQRGVARPQGASCDIGAYEFEFP